MFHSIQPITRLTEMNRLLEFQRKVLELSIAIAQGRPKNALTFNQVLGTDAGAWFLTTLNENRKSWDIYFDALAEVLKKHLSSCAAVLEAFDNDIQFHNHLIDENYRFLYLGLNQEVKKVITELFEHFYTYSYTTGYSEAIHGTPNFKLTRKALIKSHEANRENGKLEVCPICDKEISDTDIDTQTGVCEFDHFFPKAHYPFLSMHPFNLIPACGECNKKYKGTTDFLLDLSSGIPVHQSFLKVYHPHKLRSISKLGQLFISGVGNELQPYKFGIEDTEAFSSHRIESAAKAYKLLTRWTDRFVQQPNVRQRIVAQARTQVRERRKSNSIAGEYTIPDMLDTLEYLINQSKEGHYASIWVAYINFVRNNPEEQTLLLREYTSQPSPKSLE